MEPSSFFQILPNLSTTVVAIIALVFVIRLFLAELRERDKAFRSLEKEVRESIMKQLNENTSVMVRVIDKLNHK